MQFVIACQDPTCLISSKRAKENGILAVMPFPAQQGKLKCHWGKYDDNGVRQGDWNCIMVSDAIIFY